MQASLVSMPALENHPLAGMLTFSIQFFQFNLFHYNLYKVQYNTHIHKEQS